MDNTPKTLAEMAAASAGAMSWMCPRCGGRAWRVVNSYMINGRRRRQRECLNCHTPIQTYEVPVPKGYDLRIIPRD